MHQMIQRAATLEAQASLMTGAVHDFKNLLTIIVGNLHLSRDGMASETERSKHIGLALDAATRGAELTRRLLEFRAGGPAESQRVDVPRLLGELSAILECSLGARCALHIRSAMRSCSAGIHGAFLQSMLINLAVNARDAIETMGAVFISTDAVELDEAAAPGLASGPYVRVRVVDDGIGMPAKVMQQAFEPFFSTKTGERASGIGLSTVRAGAREAGGTAFIDSAPGQGTIVTILLPMDDEERGSEAIQSPGIRDAVSAAPPIVVDLEHRENESLATRALRLLGYNAGSRTETDTLPQTASTSLAKIVVTDAGERPSDGFCRLSLFSKMGDSDEPVHVLPRQQSSAVSLAELGRAVWDLVIGGDDGR